jgi:hypothetical protein
MASLETNAHNAVNFARGDNHPGNSQKVFNMISAELFVNYSRKNGISTFFISK